MNQILEWLSGGDLRSDGMSNEVAGIVLKNPQLFDDLFAGLSASDDVVRGRTADALEKVCRDRPDLLVDHLPALIQASKADEVAMVKMHLAMIFGHLANYEGEIETMIPALLVLLEDRSVYVKSWAISSLSIVGRMYPQQRIMILDRIASLQKDQSIAIRTRARKALTVLSNDEKPFPKGWIKSKHIDRLSRQR